MSQKSPNANPLEQYPGLQRLFLELGKAYADLIADPEEAQAAEEARQLLEKAKNSFEPSIFVNSENQDRLAHAFGTILAYQYGYSAMRALFFENITSIIFQLYEIDEPDESISNATKSTLEDGVKDRSQGLKRPRKAFHKSPLEFYCKDADAKKSFMTSAEEAYDKKMRQYALLALEKIQEACLSHLPHHVITRQDINRMFTSFASTIQKNPLPLNFNFNAILDHVQESETLPPTVTPPYSMGLSSNLLQTHIDLSNPNKLEQRKVPERDLN